MKNNFYPAAKGELKILLLAILVFALSCSDDDVITVDSTPPIIPDCTFNFTETAVNKDTNYIYGCILQSFTYTYPNRYLYDRPVFNPQNKNQIAYIRQDTEAPSNPFRLFTFDFCTGEANEIADNAFYGVDWGIKDWIIFTGYNQQAWKIKSNGDSLTQLTFGGSNQHAQWNDAGDIFVAQNGTDLKFADENGAELSTIENLGISFYRWRGKYIPFNCGDGFSLCLLNTDTYEYEQVEEEPDWNFLRKGIYLKQSNRVLWGNNAIGIKDLNTGENTYFYTSASNRIGSLYDVSEDEKTVLIQRANIKKISDCHKEVDVAIYLMDIDGGNERRVLIPE